MQVFRDYEGRSVRLTDERLEHISNDHPELEGMDIESVIQQTLAIPDLVMQDGIDSEVRLYFRFYYGIIVGDKYIKVVVVVHQDDAFVSTTYPVSEASGGTTIWAREN